MEENLSEQISKNATKSIKMFAAKTEQQLETGSEASQVIGKRNSFNVLLFIQNFLLSYFSGGTANAGQQRNVNFANALHYIDTQIQRMLSNMKESLPQSCFKIITESLTNLENLVAGIMLPLISKF